LFVKLGSLAQIGEGKWQLVDGAGEPRKRPYLLFRTADLSSQAAAHANLVLLDGKDEALIWSREFSLPAGREADLRQRLSLTAGRVLGCALEAREAGGLRRDLLKLFLNACAFSAESSMENPDQTAGLLRRVVAAEPRFTPAWSRLLMTDLNLLGLATYGDGDRPAALATLRSDIATAEKVDPDLPQLMLARAELLPATAYAQRLDLLAQAVERAPNNAEVLTLQSGVLQSVGRMTDSVDAASRSARLDPLSPTLTTQFVMTLAYAGRLDRAREELARAERLWAGTDALRDALWGFHLRYGDPVIAKRFAPLQDVGLDLYLNARAEPSAENADRLAAHLDGFKSRPLASGIYGWAIQALGEVGQVDRILDWVQRTPPDRVADDSYLFFRPALAPLRADPRFMTIAARIGLVDYWRKSGHWPDFCSQPDLSYNCKALAARNGR
jgi:tetratricopeptide (TPR) repeat protein